MTNKLQMLSRLFQRQWMNPRSSTNAGLFKMHELAMGRFFGHSHRRMTAAGSAAVAPSNVPCVARILNRANKRGDELMTTADYGTASKPESGKGDEARSSENEFWRDGALAYVCPPGAQIQAIADGRCDLRMLSRRKRDFSNSSKPRCRKKSPVRGRHKECRVGINLWQMSSEEYRDPRWPCECRKSPP